MKLLLKILKIVGIVIALVVAGGAIYVALHKPAQWPASIVKIELTPERLKRGEYLVNHVVMCGMCHTKRDWTRYGGPFVGKPGAGGMCFDEGHGFPGLVCGANITPDKETGIGTWTDGEIMRAIREGVDKDGEALFPIMPYGEYRLLSDVDVMAVVAYLRSLESVKNNVPESKINFPLSFFMELAPRPLDGPVAEPRRADPIALGRYLATVGGGASSVTRRPMSAANSFLVRRSAAAGNGRGPGAWCARQISRRTPRASATIASERSSA